MTVSKVLVVDEQPLIRFAVRALLTESGCSVAEVRDLRDVLRQPDGPGADLVVADIAERGQSAGLRLCHHVKKEWRTRVLVFSADASPPAIAAVLNAGADSFVHKSVSPERFTEAVGRTIAGDRQWLLGNSVEQPVPELSVAGAGLTDREKEVLGLMLQRRSNDEIAQELFLAVQTVKNYASRVLRKIGFPNRRALFAAVRPQAGANVIPFARVPQDNAVLGVPEHPMVRYS
ncbi:response regulator transcription factor [Saccharomonospora sp. NPDC006951]